MDTALQQTQTSLAYSNSTFRFNRNPIWRGDVRAKLAAIRPTRGISPSSRATYSTYRFAYQDEGSQPTTTRRRP